MLTEKSDIADLVKDPHGLAKAVHKAELMSQEEMVTPTSDSGVQNIIKESGKMSVMGTCI